MSNRTPASGNRTTSPHTTNIRERYPVSIFPTFTPTKPIAKLYFERADAIQHDVTFAQFLNDHPDFDAFGATSVEPVNITFTTRIR